MEDKNQFIKRRGWLSASVLGANDGILSTTSLTIGVAAASVARDPIILATLAGVVAGALSMAAGEYVSVSSQLDIETANLKREINELLSTPNIELNKLTKIYEKRGLTSELAIEVAKQFSSYNALEAHARDEFGITEISRAKPLQAAFASATSFLAGGIFPLLIAVFAPLKQMIFFQYGFSILFLALSGTIAAKIGGSPISESVWRICIWGTIAILMSALTGYLFKVNMH